MDIEKLRDEFERTISLGYKLTNADIFDFFLPHLSVSKEVEQNKSPKN